MTMNKDGWGAVLRGEPRELHHWMQLLESTFDPWIERVDHDVVLRSSAFDGVKTALELRDEAAVLIDVLNGALAIARNTYRVELGGAIEFRVGKTRKTSFANVTVRPDRSVFVVVKDNSQAPQPSAVQRWSSAARDDEHLQDALIFFGRAEGATAWFDLYKCLECLILRHNGEAEFFAWAGEGSRARSLKKTANWHRHAPNKYERPGNPLSYKDAREVLSALLTRALDEAVHE